MKVAKFGGSSLASAEQIRKVGQIVMSDEERRIVVVSAPGKRDESDTKVTDLLIACAKTFISTGSADNEINAVVDRYADIINGLNLSHELIETIQQDLYARLKIGADHPEQLTDALKAAGEDNNAKVVAAYLTTLGKEAEYVNPKDAGMLLSNEPGNAQILESSYKRLESLKKRKAIVVFPGFFGYTEEGVLVTFPRGGSDITGAILAAAVDADLYENFTDVDSVFAANPKIVENPKPILELTYREMRELSSSGFSVLQEETLLPVFQAKIPVCIRNTNNPKAPGTMIWPVRANITRSVSGIASENGFCTLQISKYLMNREVGFIRKLLTIIEDFNISCEHIPSGVDDISVVLRKRNISEVTLNKIIKRIENELHTDSIDIHQNIALIMLVGEGMKNSIGTAAKATRALADANINLEMINQGSSEISMMFGVRAHEEKKAVIALYNALIH